MISGISQCVFYFICDGKSGTVLSLLAIFGTVLGVGSCINIVYLMIEQRVPSEKLGSSIVVVITGSMLYSSLSSTAAYSPQPVPFLTGMSMFLVGIVMCQMLPKP